MSGCRSEVGRVLEFDPGVGAGGRDSRATGQDMRCRGWARFLRLAFAMKHTLALLAGLALPAALTFNSHHPPTTRYY